MSGARGEPLSVVARHSRLDRLWRTPKGLGALAAVNHTIVGRRFMITATVFFLIGGVLAMLIRAQLATSGAAFLDAPAYAQVFTMHGVIMMFLFAIPMIEGFALYMLPKLLGARDLAFPMLSAFGYWCYLFGGLILLAALALGAAPDAGWFMYAPLSSKPYAPGVNADVWLIGVTFVEVSAVCAAVEFMATVTKIRAAGMALNRMPILVWYLWVTAAMMLFGFPPLILGSVLLEVERAFGWPFFAPDRGGDPLLWQHLFWLFGHPEVYIIFLPGAGIVSTIIPVFAGRPLVGYSWIVVAIIALGFHSFALWVHHMFTTGIPRLSLAFFSAASLLVVVPTAVQVFSWLATLLTGRPRLSTPMLYVYGFFFVFVLGGLTGVMVAIVPFDWQAHDTHFVVAHLHYVLIGGFVFPVLAGAYHWFAQATGRQCPSNVSIAAFALIFGGFNLTFLPMHLTGLLGMPRRVHAYAPEFGWDALNLASSLGGFVLAIGFALVILEILHGALFGDRTPRNPWKAGTLEWAMPTPAPSYNFASLPVVDGREPLAADPDLALRLAAGEGLLGEPRNGWRETLAVEPIDAAPQQVVLLPGPTFVPLYTALATGLFFVSFLFGAYWLSALAVPLILACAWAWLWSSGLREDPPPVDIGRGLKATLHPAAADPPSLWGMIYAILADGVFFGSLAFGYLFLFVVAPNWPPETMIARDAFLLGASAAALFIATASAMVAARANARGAGRKGMIALLLCAASAGAGALAFAATPALLAAPPTTHAYHASIHALAYYAAAHCGLTVFIAVYACARTLRGYTSARRAVEFRALTLWQIYVAVSGAAALALVHAPVWWN